MMRTSSVTLLAAAALLAAPAQGVRAQGFTVNQGNMVPVVLTQTVSTKTNKAGDKVQAQCAGGDCGGFPKGTKFFAVLTEVSPASGKEPGKLKGKFTTAVLPEGRQIPIEAQAQAGEGVQGSTTTKKGNKGKTAAVGAAAGALVAGNDLGGALVGGAIGASLGRKKKTTGSDIEIKAGTPFQLRILKTVSVQPASKKN
jgi:hypothetical protein